MMRKFWAGEKQHLDQRKVEVKREAKERMRLLLETGDEEGYIALTKELNPEITREELRAAIERFREFRRLSSSGGSNPA